MLSKYTKQALSALYLLMGCFSVGFAQAAMQPVDWLRGMHDAVHHLNYEGRMVYQVGAELEVMHLEHKTDAEHEIERLSSLNGHSHEVLRGHSSAADVLSSHQPFSVPGTLRQQHITGLNCLLDIRRMALHYRLKLGAEHRVAGRMTQILEVKSEDKFRFSRRLYLDQETKLPLRSVLLDHAGRALAQTLFVDLQVKQAIFPHQKHQTMMRPFLNYFKAAQHWRFRNLPAGFEIIMHNYKKLEQREHFIFSDGFSMVSLYVEPLSDGSLEGYSQHGVTWILGVNKHNQQMTLLGEVPKATLQRIADAIWPAQK
jgi:sigma-E factor negative regulatory protein RseB